MKVHELFESASLDAAEQNLDRLDSAYEDIFLIKEAMDTGNFGILIGKKGNLNESDLRKIKKRIRTIIRDNPLLDGNDIRNGRDGKEKLRLLARSAAHGFETTALAAATTALGVLAVTTGPLGAIIAGTGAVAAGLLTGKQLKYTQAFRQTARMINIVDTYSKMNDRTAGKRSRFKRIMDWLSRKPAYEIERESEQRIKAAAHNAMNEFEQSIRNLPDTIAYRTHEGDIAYLPIEELFNV